MIVEEAIADAFVEKLTARAAQVKVGNGAVAGTDMGPAVDESQMEELDDLDSGTDVDVWDHKIASEMRGVVEIFAEVVDENMIVAPTAKLFDAAGRLVKHFTDGLPARVEFTMPASSPYFELEVGEQRVRQVVRTR